MITLWISISFMVACMISSIGLHSFCTGRLSSGNATDVYELLFAFLDCEDCRSLLIDELDCRTRHEVFFSALAIGRDEFRISVV